MLPVPWDFPVIVAAVLSLSHRCSRVRGHGIGPKFWRGAFFVPTLEIACRQEEHFPFSEQNSPTWYITSTNNAACKMSIAPRFVELTADVLEIFFEKSAYLVEVCDVRCTYDWSYAFCVSWVGGGGVGQTGPGRGGWGLGWG